MRGLDGERPTDRPELADVKVTRLHQPVDVLSETNGGINIYAQRSPSVCDGCMISPPMVIESKVYLARRRVEPSQMNSVFD